MSSIVCILPSFPFPSALSAAICHMQLVPSPLNSVPYPLFSVPYAQSSVICLMSYVPCPGADPGRGALGAEAPCLSCWVRPWLGLTGDPK